MLVLFPFAFGIFCVLFFFFLLFVFCWCLFFVFMRLCLLVRSSFVTLFHFFAWMHFIGQVLTNI